MKNFAFSNTDALKTLWFTAIPLMTGNLLAYGEWEALTILASHLGPAEVAAWYVPVVDNLIFGMLIHSF